MPKLSDTQIAELKAKLDPDTYAIAFREGTERAFTHPLNTEKRAGTYHCKVCGEAASADDGTHSHGAAAPLALVCSGAKERSARLGEVAAALAAGRDTKPPPS